MIWNIDNELNEVLRAFHCDLNPKYKIELDENKVKFDFNINNDIFSYEYTLNEKDDLIFKRKAKRLIKRDLYRVLVKVLKTELPYGSLNGVRPTKLYYDLLKENKNDFNKVDNILKVEFDVTKRKIKTIRGTVENQIGIYNTEKDKINFFINIPFCETRCSYCSFISHEIKSVKNSIEKYLELLNKEVKLSLDFIKENNLKIRSIYIGGGTPTSLSANQLQNLLVNLKDFDVEFTVEAGRPDSITDEKLSVLKNNNVTRISINPQTMHQKTLDTIGRKHTVEDIYNAYKLISKYKFDVNMDLIAMLPDESLEDFKYSVNECLKFNPENLTVHTLAIKKGSKLFDKHYDNDKYSYLAKEMIDFAQDRIEAENYKPYYMYRQKNMAGSLENIGFSKPKKQCFYNIDIMEETHSIMACGAGAISKKINDFEPHIERAGNVKDINQYIDRFESVLKKKFDLFEIN